ncbi:MAG: alpha/beta hydrolase-fold protein [Opitutales bacterium]
MRRIPALLAITIGTSGMPAVSQGAPAEHPHVVLEDTELHTLHSDVTGRDYMLYIGYPDSYGSEPERKYPVVYVTDGYWNFVKMDSLGSNLWYDKAVPQYIVVGLGYADKSLNPDAERRYELTPTEASNPGEPRSGGARKFLDSLKTEIIPYVEKNTRADPSFRVMAGTSLGGLFSLYCMYEEPGLFKGVIAASPAVSWDDCWMFNRSAALRNKAVGPDYTRAFSVPSRLFMSVGSEEWISFRGDILAFDQILSHGEYKDFDYKFLVIEGEKHGGNVAEAYNRGLRFVFEPLNAAETAK